MVNKLWELDMLQYKFQHMRPPRISNTAKLVKSKRSNKVKQINISKQEAKKRIKQLQIELFEERYKLAKLKLTQSIEKQIKVALSNPKLKPQDKEAYNQLSEKLEDIVSSKVIKLGSKIYNHIVKDSVDSEDEVKSELWLSEKKSVSESKPYENNSKTLNGLISRCFNIHDAKKLMGKLDYRFKIILGRVQKPVTNGEKEKDEDLGEDSDEELEGVSDDDNTSSDEEDEDGDDDDALPDEEIDPEQLYKLYKDDFAFSDEEDEFNAGPEVELNPDINYNEVTDEEPSDEEEEIDWNKVNDEKSKIGNDDFFSEEEPSAKRQKKDKKDKVILPALAGGYFSGGESASEDDDPDNDSVVKKATTQRKNRRGQRARQKIWEKKYGKKAIHVVKQHERIKSERETKQLEFEAREAKRAEKRRIQNEKNKNNANYTPLGTRSGSSGDSRSGAAPDSEQMHPSWIAKKKAEEALKNVKFQGKKKTFD
ncbi:unnamed protein product [Ambrosiozyma monospora]|uniref:Unnamed protein product n=1 Tax=Ambrosiozyma monospora TaxID=43982 RepID=A0A9W7DH01_AMBMO|nr:unnamed protein product [Ambrosiozyma monospora]